MSILLDALRKSENQRRLGETPTLYSAMPATDEPVSSHGTWLPILLCVVAAAAILWLAWDGIKAPGPPGERETASAGTAPAGPDMKSPEKPGESLTGAEPGTPASPEAGAAVAAPGLAAPGKRVQRTAEEVAGKRQQLTGRVKTYREAERVEAASPARGEDAAAPEEQLPTEPEAEPLASVPAPPGGDPPANPYQPATVSYWQIPQSLRDGLPELKISVLVYAVRPEDRFLLLNGQRMKEKDELESGLILEEIQRDRAIFTYRDYRFHLKG